MPDVYAACDRFKAAGAEFKKSPNSGGMIMWLLMEVDFANLVATLGVERELGRLPSQGGLSNEGSEYILEVAKSEFLHFCLECNF